MSKKQTGARHLLGTSKNSTIGVTKWPKATWKPASTVNNWFIMLGYIQIRITKPKFLRGGK
jgi:hypothetical protein